MSYTLPATVTGGLQTGFTAPTYTSVVDSAPDGRSKQWAFTGLGGTQVGVVAHSVNAPFTHTVRRPAILKQIGTALLNGLTGQYSRIPFNEYVTLTRKAAQVATNQWAINEFRTTGRIYAGTETFDAPNVKAGWSLHIGAMDYNSTGLGDMSLSGIM